MSLCSASADLHTGYAHPHRTNDLQVIQNEVLQLCDAATLKKTMGLSQKQVNHILSSKTSILTQ